MHNHPILSYSRSAVFFTRSTILFLCLFLLSSRADQLLKVTSSQLRSQRPDQVEVTEKSPGTIRLKLDDPSWHAGLRILPPEGEEFWNLSSGHALVVDVKNLSLDRQLRLTMHVSSGSRDAKNLREVNTGVALNPGETRAMRLMIPHQKVYEAPAGVPGVKTLNAEEIEGIVFKMQWPFEGTQAGLLNCELSRFRLEGLSDVSKRIPEDEYFPFIDVYGQNIHQDWPEKIHRDEDLKAFHQKELLQLMHSKRPPEWNKYGGWANGPQLEATGYFRVEKYQDKWYFVDPSGQLFFSQGLDVLRTYTDATPLKDHAAWFGFDTSGKDMLPFTQWNLQKKYGIENYENAFYEVLTKRLEHWGMNSVGNWGQLDFIARGTVPYTLQISDFNKDLPKISGSKLKFYDVFDPRYIQAMETLIEDAGKKSPVVLKSLTDPMCIGYFIDNELNFGNRGRQTFTDDVLRSPATQSAKKELVSDLKEKYQTIENLNETWETSYEDWNVLLLSTQVPETRNYRLDANTFFVKAVDQYFRLCRDAIKTTAPQRLYLGCRFIGTDAVRRVLFAASEKYCDVLTANIYSHTPANLWVEGFPDMPVLIGEFHFGVYDRGMFSPGLAPTGLTQEERALAYERFMQGALVHPNIVGAHWFQFRDQPLTGRWDGEGYQIGFVDVADTPYEELTRAARNVGEHMYNYRMDGKLKEWSKKETQQ